MNRRWIRTPHQRYWDKVEIKMPEECWPWTAGKTKDGYGRLYWNGKCGQTATHAGWEIIHGSPVPSDLHVLHTCDNPSCHNPAHWFLGTKQDNNADRKTKGRYDRPGHVDMPHQKLNWDKVREIRRLYASAEMNQYQIASHFGIHQTTVWFILQNRSWKEDPDANSIPGRPRKERFSVKCAWCGGSVERIRSQVVRSENYFCNYSCRANFGRKLRRPGKK